MNLMHLHETKPWEVRSSHQRCSACGGTCNFIKKRLWHRCIPVNFAKFLRTPFLTEYLRCLLLNIEFNSKFSILIQFSHKKDHKKYCKIGGITFKKCFKINIIKNQKVTRLNQEVLADYYI